MAVLFLTTQAGMINLTLRFNSCHLLIPSPPNSYQIYSCYS